MAHDQPENAAAAFSVEKTLKHFEVAWRDDRAPLIDEYLAPAPQSLRRQLLLQLIRVDLEHRWRRAHEETVLTTEVARLPLHPVLDDYRRAYPEIGTADELPLDLTVEEYRLRQRYGDHPGHAEYLSRSPRVSTELEAALRQADAELMDQPTVISSGESESGGDRRKRTDTSRPRPIRQFGEYELQEEIARGGMGVVYRARQTKLNRAVAIKMILAGQLASPEDIKRFYGEAEAAANLDHPHIVAIHEVGEIEGQHFFSMAFVDGESLSARVAQGPLPSRDAAALVKTIAEAVDYAHSHGVIHRDLKPSNVLVDKFGVPRITDFGLAKLTGSSSDLTGTGQILGTPSYMPPEQASGQLDRIGPLSDVYSLGAILYCLTTGRPPFHAAQAVETLTQVIREDPVGPRQLNKGIAPDLETICLKCLEKEPFKRYESAQHLADDLQRYLQAEPIHARPVGRLERSWRWCQRNPATAGLTAAVAVTLLAGSAISTYFGIQASHRAAEAVAGFEMAREAVDQMLTEVSESDLANVPQAEDVRRALLTKALSFYQEFLKHDPADLSRRNDVANAHYRLGEINAMLGSRETARDEYGEAIRIFGEAALDSPDKPEYSFWLAASHIDMGELLRKTGGQPEVAEAERHYRTALESLDRQANQVANEPKSIGEVARAHHSLALLLKDTNRGDEALVDLQRAITLRKQLVERDPAMPKHREDLAGSYIDLAVLFNTMPTHKPDAEAAYLEAIGILTELVSAHPEERKYRLLLAVGRVDLGNLLLQQKVHARAEDEFNKAQEMLTRLSADFPSIPLYRAELANCFNSRGNLLADAGRTDEASVAIGKAADLFRELTAEAPSVPDYQSRLGMTLGGLSWLALQRNDAERARKLVTDAIERQKAARDSNPDNPVYRKRLANHDCFLAEVLVRLNELDAAIARLTDAVDAGYNDAERLKSAVFDPLRSRDDFRHILERIDAARRQTTAEPAHANPQSG